MTPAELATEVAAVITECQERVTGVGATQYWTPGKPQKFELMPLDGLFEYAEEELRDLVVYAVMLRIRLRRLRESVEGSRIVPKAEHDQLMTALENAAVVPDWGGGSLIDARSWNAIRRAMAAYLPICEQERTDE